MQPGDPYKAKPIDQKQNASGLFLDGMAGGVCPLSAAGKKLPPDCRVPIDNPESAQRRLSMG